MKEISESWREPVTMTPIGVIRTPFNTREETPKDGKVLPEAEGELIVDEKYLEAMADMAVGKQYQILFVFNRSVGYKQTVALRGTGPMTGLFSTHAPSRPNPIGVSVITVTAIDGSCLRFTGVDMMDGTPVLDIKSWT